MTDDIVSLLSDAKLCFSFSSRCRYTFGALCNRLGGATGYDRTNSSEMAKWQEIKLQMPNGKVIDTGAPITVPVGEQTLGNLDCVGCQSIDLRVLSCFL